MVPDRGGRRVAVHGHRQALRPSCSSSATTRATTAARSTSTPHAFLGYVRAVASSVAILAYCLWAFEESDRVGDTTWFELSIIPFVLGVLRYALLLEQGGGGAPEELVLADRTLLVHRRGLGGDVRGGGAWLSRDDARHDVDELLTGWGRTAPEPRDRARGPGASTRSSTA